MAFLTTMRLTRRARCLARDSQAVHRTLAHTIGGRHLWSMPEPDALVVQHAEPVDWAHALPGLIAHSHTIERRTHQAGAHIEWAMIANPVAAIKEVGLDRGKRRALPPEKWNSWVERKLAPALEIHRIDGAALSTAVGKHHDMRTIHRRVLFTGTGTVSDPAFLDELRDKGVGPGKAYGCGLLITQDVNV